MASELLLFNDVSLTDGQSVTWGGAMTTPMAARLARSLDDSGFGAIEVINSQVMSQCLKRGEDPWQRLEVLRYQNPSVPFRASINLLTEHGKRGADITGNCVVEWWLAELEKRDISQVVIVDPLLCSARLAGAFQAARELNMIAIGVLPFLYEADDSYFSARAKALVELGAQRIMLRDEGGVLDPDRAARLLPALVDALGDTALILHTRCSTGLGPLVAIDAAALGVAELDTVLPALANGGSLPSGRNLVKALDIVNVGAREPGASACDAADAALVDMAQREGLRLAEPWVFDLAPYVHQLSGEVAGWAMERLRSEGRWHLLHEYAQECARVRADIGSPPMIFPFARSVAEQAFINLGADGRYREIKPVVRRALQGVYSGCREDGHAELQAWVGAIEFVPPTKAQELAETNPETARKQLLLELVCGVPVAEQPTPCPVEHLVYDQYSAGEFLARALAEYAPDYACLSVTGPGVDIRFPVAGGPA